MFWSENAGEIAKCPDQENQFYWEVPNYFAYQSSTYQFETVNPRIVSSPWFSAFNRNWRLALVLNTTNRHTYVGFFIWMASSNEIPNIKVQLIALDRDDIEYANYNGEIDSNGHFGDWGFLTLASLSSDKHIISPAGVLTLLCILEEKIDISSSSECSASPVSSTSDANVGEIWECIFCTFINPADVLNCETCGNPQATADKHLDKVDMKTAENATVEDIAEPEAKGVDRLLQNLKNIFLEKQSSDAILKVKDSDFKVHKAILIARSPVFASMFKDDTKESTTGVVDIPDCSEAAFEAFLLYLYTASINTMSQANVFDLYYTADKYQVNDLKSECIEYIANNLSAENFCVVMTLSLKHNESGLQEKARSFFCNNFKTIIRTVQWQRYLRDFPTEANALYIKAVNA